MGHCLTYFWGPGSSWPGCIRVQLQVSERNEVKSASLKSLARTSCSEISRGSRGCRGCRKVGPPLFQGPLNRRSRGSAPLPISQLRSFGPSRCTLAAVCMRSGLRCKALQNFKHHVTFAMSHIRFPRSCALKIQVQSLGVVVRLQVCFRSRTASRPFSSH